MSTAPNLDNETIEMIVVLIKGYKRNGFNDQEIRFKLRKKFEEDEINSALQLCADTDASQTLDANPSLKEPNDYFGWYHGPKESGEYHWPRLKESLLHKDVPWTKEMIKNLDEASTLVVANMAPPDSTKSVKCKGLVLGYIQSGKTANFSATIAKAIDEGLQTHNCTGWYAQQPQKAN
jgi:hypothetical protein